MKIILQVYFILLMLLIPVSYAQSEPLVTSYYGIVTENNIPRQGASITVHDAAGNKIADDTSREYGLYTVLVPWDDPATTNKDEGVVEGETTTFKVNGIKATSRVVDAKGTNNMLNLTFTSIFDTGMGGYPSISGIHNGTIKLNQILTVNRLYTYSSEGTGGHTEYIRIWNSTSWNVSAKWNGYTGDWHNIAFEKPFVLETGLTYNYTIITGSYPQIIHNKSHSNSVGTITSDEFIDANGRRSSDWIPAIRME